MAPASIAMVVTLFVFISAEDAVVNLNVMEIPITRKNLIKFYFKKPYHDIHFSYNSSLNSLQNKGLRQCSFRVSGV